MPRDERRSTGAHAERLDGLDRRRAKARVVREAQVVVARKVEELGAPFAHPRGLRGIQHPPDPQAFLRKILKRHAMPREASRASSRATSGLAVVRSFSP